MVFPTETHFPGNSVLSLKTKIKTKILGFLDLVFIFTSEILESPPIWEVRTFLWSIFQLPVSISHLINSTFRKEMNDFHSHHSASVSLRGEQNPSW